MSIKITPIGDIHNGRQTELVETEKTKYIKKPRDCKTEVAFCAFVEQLSLLGFSDFSRSPKILEIGEGFHTQMFEENHPTDEKGIDDYYYRSGVLLFVCYLFSSTDMHCENVIANGDMPVLVDMETLMSGKIARAPKLYNLTKSVLCSHLLCNFARNDNKILDVSGFSGVTSGLNNVPRVKEKHIFLWEKTTVFLKGFENAYKFFLENKTKIRPLILLFENCDFRQILRPTATYDAISTLLTKVDEEKRKSLAENILSRAYKRDIDKNRIDIAKDILLYEIEAVLKNEIPLFYTKGTSKHLFANEQKLLQDYLEISPVDNALERLDKLSHEDLQRQKKIIELAISASTPIEKSKGIFINTSALAEGEISAGIVSKSRVSNLPSIFTELKNSADGVVVFGSSGLSLYSGLTGVLCMYAAMYRKTEKKVYLDNLFQGYENFSHIFDLYSDKKIDVCDSNVSLSDGITGFLASIIHIGELLEDSAFLKDAYGLANRLSFAGNFTNFDYLGGAGALPIMLKKLKIDILEHCFDICKDFNLDEICTTGAAHGAAGLALTLATTECSVEKIKVLLDWENNYFSADDENWFDLRDKTKKGFMSGWCGGAPGIGMARLALKSFVYNDDISSICDNDIARAKNFLKKAKPSKRDSLCCGSASRLMAASRIGIRLDELYSNLSNAEKNLSLRFVHPADTADINVSLMQGYSGVAYALAMYGDPLSGGMLL